MEGRLGVVLDPELDGLGQLVAGDPRGERQRHVDPGRHPSGREHFALLDHPAVAHGDSAVLRQRVEAQPVRGRLQTVEDAGGGQHQRAGAHRRRPLRVLVGVAQPAQHLLVLHQRSVPVAAGDDDHVGLGELVERPVRHQGQHPGLSSLGAGLLRDEVDSRAR